MIWDGAWDGVTVAIVLGYILVGIPIATILSREYGKVVLSAKRMAKHREASIMRLLVGHSHYLCAECRNAVLFENVPGTYRSNLYPEGYAIGACQNSRCSQYERRCKVVMPVLEVEYLPRIAEWGDLFPPADVTRRDIFPDAYAWRDQLMEGK
jgi:hypothetical protein